LGKLLTRTCLCHQAA